MTIKRQQAWGTTVFASKLCGVRARVSICVVLHLRSAQVYHVTRSTCSPPAETQRVAMASSISRCAEAVYMHVCMHSYARIYIYTSIHTYINTYMHTQTKQYTVIVYLTLQ